MVFFQSKFVSIYSSSRFYPDITEMPGLVVITGDVFFMAGIALYETEQMGVLP